jgi:hypothetical protein
VIRHVWVRHEQDRAQAGWLMVGLALVVFVVAFAAMAGGQAMTSVHAVSKVEVLASADGDGNCGSTTGHPHQLRCSAASACASWLVRPAMAFLLSIQPHHAWSSASALTLVGQILAPGLRPPILFSNA